MRLTALLRRQVTWLALSAVTFAGVAPAISQWVASTTGTLWVEICSTAGVKRVALDAGKAPAPAEEHGGKTHCPFCRLQSDLPAVRTASAALFPMAEAQDRHLPSFITSPALTRPVWPSALSRAPPRTS